MSSVTHRVKLVLRATGAVVDAELREGIQESNLRDWDDKWQPIIDAKLKKAQLDPHVQLPAAWHWNWRSLKNNMSDPLNDFSFCIEYEGLTQGMMIVSTAKHAKMKGQEGQHLVYVDRLETAPWNRPEYTARARLNGVGSILIIAAITFSLGEEFKGRIGLHSLPNANAFYLKCGMTDLGPDRKYDNLHYFEMTPEQAKDFREGKEKS